ncbi:hypothetical protein L208DRAFT_1413482 [Tricholoma matsutake]|nr:hypothetical protein L208DRAFT_1413482 [Tricholoma matsutake 945]
MADLIKCLWCSFCGAQTDFPCKPNLQYLKTCATCNTKQNGSAGKNFTHSLCLRMMPPQCTNSLSSLAMALQHIL